MKLLRRSLVLCLSLILCLSVFIVSAGAAGETFTVSYNDGGVSYSFTFKVVEEGKVNITKLNYTSGTTLTIPGKVTNEGNEYTVAGN